MKRDLEHCFVCGAPLPYGGLPHAVYHAGLRIRYCDSNACREVVDGSVKDYSRSTRGKWRSRTEALRIIESKRMVQA